MSENDSSKLLTFSPFLDDGGELIGEDPRKVDPEILKEHFSSRNPLKAIRAKCIDCCGGNSAEVRKCTATGCPLWPFRMNKNPFHASFGKDNRKSKETS